MSGQRARSAVEADHRSVHPNIPGLPWWGAVLLAATAAAIGFAFDAGSANKELSSAFSACYALGCIAAVLAVRQSGVFTAVIQPPLILFVAVPGSYFLLHKGQLEGVKDLLINCGYPLIERFPLMLFTSAAVLLIGMARWYFGASKRRAARKTAADTETKAAAGGGLIGAVSSKVSSLVGLEPEDVEEPAPPRRRSSAERPARAAKGDTAAKPDRARRSDRTDRPGRTERPDRTDDAARAARAADRAERRPTKRSSPSRSRHARPPETEIIEPVEPIAERPRRPRPTRRTDPPPPSGEPRRRPRPQPEREPREPRQAREPREPRESRRVPPLEHRGAERPPRRRRLEDVETREPQGTNGSGLNSGSNGSHHPISRVRYRNVDDGEDRVEHRTRPRHARRDYDA